MALITLPARRRSQTAGDRARSKCRCAASAPH